MDSLKNANEKKPLLLSRGTKSLPWVGGWVGKKGLSVKKKPKGSRAKSCRATGCVNRGARR